VTLTIRFRLCKFAAMNFGILFEKVEDQGFPAGYFYAHIPSLGLTTHGLGLDGARQAALDLAQAWLAEKKAQGEPFPVPSEILFSTLEVPDDALQGA
jgi:predicted RNase H-like HicB family nuclease